MPWSRPQPSQTSWSRSPTFLARKDLPRQALDSRKKIAAARIHAWILVRDISHFRGPVARLCRYQVFSRRALGKRDTRDTTGLGDRRDGPPLSHSWRASLTCSSLASLVGPSAYRTPSQPHEQQPHFRGSALAQVRPAIRIRWQPRGRRGPRCRCLPEVLGRSWRACGVRQGC